MSDVRKLSATEASELVATGWTIVDVRTEDEFAAGHAVGAYNVPFLLSVSGQMLPNPEFFEVFERAFEKDERLVLSCAAGGRSAKAATALAARGYSSLADLRGGFNGARDAFGQVTERGWLAAGLPVEQASDGRGYSELKRRA
jgi:rhodanese-related sulfurtransferase